MLVFSSPALASDPALTFIETHIAQAQKILTDTQLSSAERTQQFQTLLLSMTDMKRVALFTAGPYGARAPEMDKQHFIAAFTAFSIGYYQDVLSRYADRKVRLTGVTWRSEDDAVVSATIANANGTGEPIKIGFRVRGDGSAQGLMLTDVQIEGAWLSLTQRAEFLSFLQQHHGDLMELSAELQRKAAQIAARE